MVVGSTQEGPFPHTVCLFVLYHVCRENGLSVFFVQSFADFSLAQRYLGRARNLIIFVCSSCGESLSPFAPWNVFPLSVAQVA